jgi:hypothetical protein
VLGLGSVASARGGGHGGGHGGGGHSGGAPPNLNIYLKRAPGAPVVKPMRGWRFGTAR